MKRRVMTLQEVRDEQRDYFEAMGDDVDSMDIMSLVEVENMGWCKDGATRWYHFDDENGNPAVYYKH